jgi:hypothetical protein
VVDVGIAASKMGGAGHPRCQAMVLVLGLGLAGLASCGRHYEGYQASYQLTAERAAANLAHTIHASALLAAAVDGSPSGPYDNADAILKAVNAAVATASGHYQPPGCVTGSAMTLGLVGPVLPPGYTGPAPSPLRGYDVFRFNDCAGPFGVAHLSGALVVTLGQDALDLQVSLAGHLPGAAVFPDCVMGPPSVTCQPVDLTGSYQAVFGPDRALHFGTVGLLTWDQGLNCLALDNAIPFRDTDTYQDIGAVSGFHQCGAACPTSGTASEINGATAGGLTIRYDGTNKPGWSSSDGYNGTVTLDCQ